MCVKNRYTSISTNASPGHRLSPRPNGIKCSGMVNLPLESRNLTKMDKYLQKALTPYKRIRERVHKSIIHQHFETSFCLGFYSLRVNNTVLPMWNAVQVINNETMFVTCTCMGQTLMDFSRVCCHGEDSKHWTAWQCSLGCYNLHVLMKNTRKFFNCLDVKAAKNLIKT